MMTGKTTIPREPMTEREWAYHDAVWAERQETARTRRLVAMAIYKLETGDTAGAITDLKLI